MSETDKRPREFEPVKPAEAESLLTEGAKSFSSTMIWTKDQARVINSTLSYFSKKEGYLYVAKPKDLDPIQFMDELARAKEAGCFFSVSLSRANVFFKARYIGYEKSGLMFKMPEQVFKVQRRKDLRYSIPSGYVLSIEFFDPLEPEKRIIKKAHDISAGGLSFLVSESEKSVYVPDLLLREVMITIQRKTLVLSGKVQHIAAIRTRGGMEKFKVGVKFLGIRPGESQLIANYVFEESRKFFTRFL